MPLTIVAGLSRSSIHYVTRRPGPHDVRRTLVQLFDIQRVVCLCTAMTVCLTETTARLLSETMFRIERFSQYTREVNMLSISGRRLSAFSSCKSDTACTILAVYALWPIYLLVNFVVWPTMTYSVEWSKYSRVTFYVRCTCSWMTVSSWRSGLLILISRRFLLDIEFCAFIVPAFQALCDNNKIQHTTTAFKVKHDKQSKSRCNWIWRFITTKWTKLLK